MNFFYRYNEVKNLVTLQTRNKTKRGKNNERNDLWHLINTCQTGQWFSLSVQIKPVEEVALNNLQQKEQHAIHKSKINFISALSNYKALAPKILSVRTIKLGHTLYCH